MLKKHKLECILLSIYLLSIILFCNEQLVWNKIFNY
mgnify:FL=1